MARGETCVPPCAGIALWLPQGDGVPPFQRVCAFVRVRRNVLYAYRWCPVFGGQGGEPSCVSPHPETSCMRVGGVRCSAVRVASRPSMLLLLLLLLSQVLRQTAVVVVVVMSMFHERAKNVSGVAADVVAPRI